MFTLSFVWKSSILWHLKGKSLTHRTHKPTKQEQQQENFYFLKLLTYSTFHNTGGAFHT